MCAIGAGRQAKLLLELCDVMAWGIKATLLGNQSNGIQLGAKQRKALLEAIADQILSWRNMQEFAETAAAFTLADIGRSCNIGQTD